MNWNKSNKRTAGALGLLGTGAVAGAIVAAVIPANAATSTTAPSASSSTAPSGTTSFPAHGTAAHESQETPVTGANATKAQAAAVKAAGGGTAGAVTTDMTGTGYEVTVTLADGSSVEEHLDSSFAVMNHGGSGAPDAPGSSTSDA